MKRLTLLASAAFAVALPAQAQLVPPLEANPQQRVAAADPGARQGQQGQPGQPGQPPQFVPTSLPPAVSPISPGVTLRRREAVNVAAATRWRQAACSPTRGRDGVLTFQQGACEITIVCAPFRVCDVALMPGEVPTATPSIGDPRIGLQPPKMSGAGAEKTVHLVFQPSDAGLSSSVVLHTDRRTITMLVVTRQNEYMPLVALADGTGSSGSAGMGGWASLAAQGAAGSHRDPCDAAPTVPPSQYRISTGGIFGAAPEWKPIQVYGVALPNGGPATCIEFPADVASIDAPILVPTDGPGGAAGVDTVRPSTRRYRVDRSLARFDLVSGIGWDQQRVSVRRK